MKRHNEVIGELRNLFRVIPDSIKFETLLAFMDTSTVERMLNLVKSQDKLK